MRIWKRKKRAGYNWAPVLLFLGFIYGLILVVGVLVFFAGLL